MNNLDINQILAMISKMDKTELEKNINEAQQILQNTDLGKNINKE